MKFLKYKRDVEHHYDDGTWYDRGAVSYNVRLLMFCWGIGIIVIVIASLVISNVYLPVDENHSIITEFEVKDTTYNDGVMSIDTHYKTIYGYVNRITHESFDVNYPINPIHFITPIIVAVISSVVTSYFRKKETNYDD